MILCIFTLFLIFPISPHTLFVFLSFLFCSFSTVDFSRRGVKYNFLVAHHQTVAKAIRPNRLLRLQYRNIATAVLYVCALSFALDCVFDVIHFIHDNCAQTQRQTRSHSAHAQIHMKYIYVSYTYTSKCPLHQIAILFLLITKSNKFAIERY